ncbi:7-cyano-7-deazaguanine synthase, partial [Streptococcus pneumoniae]
MSHFGRSTMKRQSALVVFSGGQDSTTCLFWVMQHY